MSITPSSMSFPVTADKWNFPTLFKFSEKTNKTTAWNIEVRTADDGFCEIIRTYGFLDSKLTKSVKHIRSGKNIGRSNETSVFQQACSEALSLWKRQLETHGYSQQAASEKSTFPDATSGIESSSSMSGFANLQAPSPMLAHLFDKHSAKIKYPCFSQPKLDGVRMLATYVPSTDSVVCYSRTGKAFTATSLKLICNHIKSLYKKHTDLQHFWFDGELYTPDLSFEDIVSVCRNGKTPNQNFAEKINYHVYDLIPVTDKFKLVDFEDRISLLKDVIFNTESADTYVKLVSTSEIKSFEEVVPMHDEYFSKGYEGIMIRNSKGKYQNSRSYNLLKYKVFTDDEFQITSVKEATGNDEGTAVLQCKTANDILFWVRPRGSRAFRSDLLRDAKSLIGKYLTVRYQNLTERAVPRFPVGISVRDYE